MNFRGTVNTYKTWESKEKALEQAENRRDEIPPVHAASLRFTGMGHTPTEIAAVRGHKPSLLSVSFLARNVVLFATNN